MDDRLQSRFHVCLELSELTAATRGQIWQKCLESHKDVKFFDNFTTLGQWTLNGREIANAVTAAKTLIKGGTMEMKHLERVVPLEKQTVTIEADTSQCFKPKDKNKKSEKPVTDFELLPPPPPPPPAEVPEPVEPVLTETDGNLFGDWGNFTKPKKSKKKVAVVDDKPLPEPEPMSPAIEEAMLVVEDAPKTCETADEWGTFGVKKDKKKKKKEVKSVEVTEELQPASVPEEKAEVTDKVVPVVEDDDFGWGAFLPDKKKKKSKKASETALDFGNIPDPPVENVTKGDDVDDIWGAWGKKKKTPEPNSSTNKEAEADPAPNDELAPPPPPPAEVDDWGFWTSSAKSKKKKEKKGVIAWDTPPVEATQPDLPVPQEDAPLLANKSCQTCARTEPVIQGQYCKYCGTFEGERKVVCFSCAGLNEYVEYEVPGRHCKVCKKIIK